MGIFSFFSREKKQVLDEGLSKTKESIFGKIARAIAGKSEIDDEVLDNLEEVLVTSDVGVETTLKIIDRVQKRAARDKFMNTNELNRMLKDEIAQLLMENNTSDGKGFDLPTTPGTPHVIMVVGVNGVGKTTTIGKLAHQFKKAGKKVYLGAADTFRAAAVEQLVEWGHRADVPVIKQGMGSDPASVAFDTLSSAVANDADVVIIDTAGRLHNKAHLMEELKKISRVVEREYPEATVKALLVIDATTGQNGLAQAQVFSEVANMDGIILTKLDGTAKGGIAVAIRSEMGVPVRYIGLGEQLDDMQPFDAKQFVDAIF